VGQPPPLKAVGQHPIAEEAENENDGEQPDGSEKRQSTSSGEKPDDEEENGGMKPTTPVAIVHPPSTEGGSKTGFATPPDDE